jgi:hypothetical protein
MKTQVKDMRMYGLMVLFEMHTDYFKRALEGIPDDAALNRLGTDANHMAWLAGSLLQERFELARLFGRDLSQKNADLFADHKGIQNGVKYPPLSDFIADWNTVSPIVAEILSNLSAEKLDSDFDMMGTSMKHYELISFMTYREAACIGQLALWRRLLGFPALRYDDN